ncbi:4-azaleucine resistance transporter AzlC [Pseudorhizobium tarimense]|uniref:4-azaleucine resistance transporter AzlC n=1 Tax=Pseudorhizobium tarimense TaxID=1079109 RepID=A0ABV2H667_9HYPH|nr:AzlC family ABC transporter permease [Pseudorhizobium tarimense]MCJ8519153.1 AzlC family ABC transporter permease [Pseudorhizobium tarimense]
MHSPVQRLDDFATGMRAILPLLIAVIPVGAVFGTVAATKGMSAFEAVLMSAMVFAGGSQFVALDLWTHPASWTVIGFAALLVNMRHVLMGGSIADKMGRFSLLQRWAAMLFLADEIWAMAEARARTVTGLSPAWYAGIVAPFYGAWVLSTLAGAALGATLGDPAVIGLDFAFPAVFIVLILGFWKGRATAAIIGASAVAALIIQQTTNGVWYIIAGAAAGLLCAAFVESESVEGEEP